MVKEEDDDETSRNALNMLVEKTEKKIRQQSIYEDESISPCQKVPLTIFDGENTQNVVLKEEEEDLENDDAGNSSDECMQEIVSPFRGVAKLNEGPSHQQ